MEWKDFCWGVSSISLGLTPVALLSQNLLGCVKKPSAFFIRSAFQGAGNAQNCISPDLKKSTSNANRMLFNRHEHLIKNRFELNPKSDIIVNGIRSVI